MVSDRNAVQPRERTVPVRIGPVQAVLVSDSSAATFELGRRLGGLVEAGDIVGLLGDLGAGKTCFTQGVGQGVGVDPRDRVRSPTFTLINEHPGRLLLIHADLYRVGELDELVEIGLFDYLGGSGVCVIEWFERLGAQRPAERLEIDFQLAGDELRRLHLEAWGERHAALLQAFLHADAQDPRHREGPEAARRETS